MRYIQNHTLNPSFNLAFEEEVLNSDLLSELPAFSLWRNPSSVIIGVSQIAENEVNLEYCSANQVPVVRRKSGGGAVYHDLGNLNYTFFFPYKLTGNPYHHIYMLLSPAFEKLGIDIELSGTNDLLLDGRKFSGMAERVVEGRSLVHGTILYNTDMEVMADALSTDGSKFKLPRGVASRRASVVNLKPYLREIRDTEHLRDELARLLSDKEGEEIMPIPEGLRKKICLRAEKDYAPVNKKEIER